MGASVRRTLHFVVADVLYYSGTLAFLRFFRREILRRKETCVFGLHRVLTKAEQERTNSLEGMVLSDSTFEKLLEYLRRRFDVISLGDLLKDEGGRNKSGKPRCLLTFDDGWSDTYSRAHPWLKKFEMPAVVFLATGSIEGKRGFWVEEVNGAFRAAATRSHIDAALRGMSASNGSWRTAEDVIEWLKHMPARDRDPILRELLPCTTSSTEHERADEIDAMMTWKDALQMRRDGVEMGAHTVTHPLLSYEGDEDVERELRLSKKTVEEKLGVQVRAFAYPNGDWDERVRRWVEQTGYECAFTTEAGWYQPDKDRFGIPRLLLHEGNVTGRDGQFSPAMFNLTLAGRT